MATKWSPKDPDDVLDYVVDWDKNWLPADDTIVTSTWVDIDPEITIESHSIIEAGKKVMIWISGGVDGTTYYLTNRIDTILGRTKDQTIPLKCKSQ